MAHIEETPHQPTTLQTQSILSLIDNLTEIARSEVISDIFKTMTLKEILEHPVVLEGYKHEIESRALHRGGDSRILYLIRKTNDPILILKLFHGLFIYNPSWKRCYCHDGKLVVINDYYDSTIKFELDHVNVVHFDFERDIVNSNISLEQVFELTVDRHISNPAWIPGTHIPQCIPVGQKLVPWWYGLLRED